VTQHVRNVDSLPQRKKASNSPSTASTGGLSPIAYTRPNGLYECLLFLVQEGIVAHDALDALLVI